MSRVIYFALAFALMFSFCFAAQEAYQFPEQVVYADETYYLHSTDQAEVGEINTYEGGGLGGAIGAAAQFADLEVVFNVDITAPKEIYDITQLEAKRLEAIAKMNLGEQIQVYASKIESELAKSTPSTSKLRTAWEDMAVYMENLRKESKTPAYTKKALTFYMKKIGFLTAAGNPVSITDAWVARNGMNMNKVVKAFSSRGAFQILANTGGTIYEYAEAKLGKIGTKMGVLNTKITSKGFVVKVGALQGLEITKEGTVWVKIMNKVPGAARIADLVKPFFLEKIDKILTLGKYVSSLKKYDLFMMSRAGKVQSLMDKVKNARTPETTAKRFAELQDEVSQSNKFFKRFGVGEEAFKLTGTGKTASLEVLRGSRYIPFTPIGESGRAALGIGMKTLGQSSAFAKFGSWFKTSWLGNGLRIIGKGFAWMASTPIIIGTSILRAGVWGICLNQVYNNGMYAEVAPYLSNLTVNDEGSPSLYLFTNFLEVDRCINDHYAGVLGAAFGGGFDPNSTASQIAGGVYDFVDLTKLVQDAEEGMRKRVQGLRFYDCQAAVYSKEKPDAVKKISEYTGAFACVDSEFADDPDMANVIDAGTYPEGEYIAFERISVGEGAAESVWPYIFNYDAAGTDSKRKQFDDSKLKTYTMLALAKGNNGGVCMKELTELLTETSTGTNLSIAEISGVQDMTGLAPEKLAKIVTLRDSFIECVAKEGYFTETVKFEGTMTEMVISPDDDTITLNMGDKFTDAWVAYYSKDKDWGFAATDMKDFVSKLYVNNEKSPGIDLLNGKTLAAGATGSTSTDNRIYLEGNKIKIYIKGGLREQCATGQTQMSTKLYMYFEGAEKAVKWPWELSLVVKCK